MYLPRNDTGGRQHVEGEERFLAAQADGFVPAKRTGR